MFFFNPFMNRNLNMRRNSSSLYLLLKPQIDIFTFLFVYRLNKQDTMCSLVRFGGAGLHNSFTLDRTRPTASETALTASLSCGWGLVRRGFESSGLITQKRAWVSEYSAVQNCNKGMEPFPSTPPSPALLVQEEADKREMNKLGVSHILWRHKQSFCQLQLKLKLKFKYTQVQFYMMAGVSWWPQPHRHRIRS